MSEYQYYEWQTIDRPLTTSERREVDALSSHMDTVTSTQAIVTYSWGDFKHDPAQVLLKFFDAFLYDSNFGSRRVMFRLPKDLVDVDAIRPYCLEYWITLEEHGKYFVLDISGNDEDGYEWVETEGTLGQLTSLREQVLQGDCRMLYLMWLKAMESDPDIAEDEPGPPIPAGLKELNAGLQAFAEFFDINPHLIAAAAASSKKAASTPETDLASALSKLTRSETDHHLLQILNGEPGAVLMLKKRLMELSGKSVAPSSPAILTIGEMIQQAEIIEQEALRKVRQEAERQRIQRLEKLAQQEEAAWAKVEGLLDQKRGSAYDEATRLLAELHELAKLKKWELKYQERFRPICLKYGKSVALMRRFHHAGLL
jgi:hypothetical protein